MLETATLWYSEEPCMPVQSLRGSSLFVLFIVLQYLSRLAADIVDSRLELAKQAGANVTINCLKENLKERGLSFICCLSVCSSRDLANLRGGQTEQSPLVDVVVQSLDAVIKSFDVVIESFDVVDKPLIWLLSPLVLQ